MDRQIDLFDLGVEPKKAEYISVVSSRLVKEKDSPDRVRPFSGPESAVEIVEGLFDMSNLPEERMVVCYLDTKNYITGMSVLSIGTVNASLINPREVFRMALLYSAVHIILVHNHPSGITDPSREDLKVTERIRDAGKLIGIVLLDHIIVGDGNYYSIKEHENIL